MIDRTVADSEVGYFIAVLACPQIPELVGREFDWCLAEAENERRA